METINRAFAELTASRNENVEAQRAWTRFCEAITMRVSRKAPAHYRLLFELVGASGDRKTFRILDHGCGSGRTVLILRALGYSGAQGIDLQHAPIGDKWNAWLPQEAVGSVQPFLTYDGKRLPFADAALDLIFSQQVIEHLPPTVFETYFSEEGRVLKPGGHCYHQAPHRLSPYDSHSDTWFIHWLPRAIQLRLYSAFGCKTEWLNEHLHLRMPHVIKEMIAKHIGPCMDRTMERVADSSMLYGYDGTVVLRRIISRLGAFPAMSGVLATFLMREFVAQARPDRD